MCVALLYEGVRYVLIYYVCYPGVVCGCCEWFECSVLVWEGSVVGDLQRLAHGGDEVRVLSGC